MKRQSYKTMVADLAGKVDEIFPWDLADELAGGANPLLLDIRCPHEFDVAHIEGSVNVPRGILEIAADYGYEETNPELVEARGRRVIVICRSGNRSLLAAYTLRLMGYTDVSSLRLGVRGWNDYDQPLVAGSDRRLDPDLADDLLTSKVTAEQLGPQMAEAA